MILGRESFGSAPITIEKKSSVDDIEINDDAPESKPSLEELDALEVKLISLSSLNLNSLMYKRLNMVYTEYSLGTCQCSN